MEETRTTPLFNHTQTESDSIVDQDRKSEETSVQVTDDELTKEIVEILGAARRGLTEDSICALLALRREVGWRLALGQLLLDGVIVAEVIDENSLLRSSNYSLRRWPVDETSTRDIASEPAA